MTITRTTLLDRSTASAGFRLERWFIPVDGPEESLTYAALIFDRENIAYYAILSPEFAQELAKELANFHSTTTG